ncbi:AraC family transcriptional regulator [uncultured Duncaniella sp.]|uniref:AraC family transcriptional regulator n=1 Tax=uncultured Duncaniella sp. TaxID=2768039 RepID=UPI00321FE676
MESIKYLLANERDQQWGLSVSSIGAERFGPGDAYPSPRHSESYLFRSNVGRVFDEYQLVYISEGEGFFESASVARTKIVAGTMFLLFPGEWHTFSPTPSVGWTQYWIGFKGANVDLRVENRFLSKNSPIFRVGVNDMIIRLYNEAIEVARGEVSCYQLLLAGIVNHLLGLMYVLDHNCRFEETNSGIADKIKKAQVIMLESVYEPVMLQDIALRVGMSYSSFRQHFREYTGCGPASYLRNLRLERAMELITKTSLTLKEIAYTLNFKSPEYFSLQFKKAFGRSPSEYRD